MAARIILETERLLLREFGESDAAAFHLLGSDPAITRYTGDPGGGFKCLQQAREVLRAHPMEDYRKHGFGRWACVLKASDEVIGFAGLKYLDDLDEVDIGYRLMPVHWGAGLATESSRAVLDHGFTRLRLERIIGLVDPRNVASVRVLRKLGLNFAEVIDYEGLVASKYVIHANSRTVNGAVGESAEPVVVAPYDSTWPMRFDEERSRLAAIFGGADAVIEHVGSTAVPHLGAKPILDVMVGVGDLSQVEERIHDLQGLGYKYVPDYEKELPERRYFRKPHENPRTHHLHGVVRNSDFWRLHLLFRDQLRAYPTLAGEYHELKLRLASQFRFDRLAYTEAKSRFIEAALQKATHRPPEP